MFHLNKKRYGKESEKSKEGSEEEGCEEKEVMNITFITQKANIVGLLCFKAFPIIDNCVPVV